MNRWDEVQGLARDIASNVHADPAARDAMANDLIKLCGAMINAVGKGVAIDGESAMNDDDDSAHARYLLGERIQSEADQATEHATNADLDRWTRPTPGDPCQCGHVPSVHVVGRCTGETYNGEPCKGGPCNGFVRRVPEWGWRHTDRRPAALRESATQIAAPQRACCYVATCATCRNGGPVGRCCYPLRDVCPSHH